MDTDNMSQSEIVSAIGQLIEKCEATDLAAVTTLLCQRAADTKADGMIIGAFLSPDHVGAVKSIGVCPTYASEVQAMGVGAALLGVAYDTASQYVANIGVAANLCPTHFLQHVVSATMRAIAARKEVEKQAGGGA